MEPGSDKVSYIEQILQLEEDNHNHHVSICLPKYCLKIISERLFLLISSLHKKWNLPSRKSLHCTQSTTCSSRTCYIFVELHAICRSWNNGSSHIREKHCTIMDSIYCFFSFRMCCKHKSWQRWRRWQGQR